ncbi:MAG TPA: cytochrome P450 [Streptosporangiaceae bacterium]|jgi:pentalenene oxygenase|nr:cytochrome P450 [Streptosporangiaceae bacterium]
MRFGRAPGAWPFLGHVIALRHRPLRLLDSLPAYGDLVEIRLGPRPAFVLCHPDLARQVLTDFHGFDRTGLVYERVRMAMGSGLATATHQDHRRQRLVMQPAFGHEYLRGYVAVMRQEVTAVMDKWQDGDLVDMVDEMFKLTTTVALRALFSSQLGSGEAEQLRQAFDAFLRGIYARAVLPMGGRLPTPSNRHYARAVAHWRGQVNKLINGYRQAGAGRGDLMSRLLAARDEQGQGMSDKELADQVAVLMLAGGETTSAAVVWSLHLLSGHPQVLDALHAETDAVLGRDVAGWEHLPRLDLAARVVREALRLYPPAWAIPRISVRETILAGRTLPAGSMVIFSPYILHRRPDLYPRPRRFDPGRWLAPAQGAAAAHRASFLPFGAGATKCIGEEFGFAEATLVLASIVARWDLYPEAGTTVSPAARAVLVPKAFPVRLSGR